MLFWSRVLNFFWKVFPWSVVIFTILGLTLSPILWYLGRKLFYLFNGFLLSLLLVVPFSWFVIAVANIPDSDSSIKFMLAAISEGSAGILVIILTGALIVDQLSSRYSTRFLGESLNYITFVYMLLLFACILVPLIPLLTGILQNILLAKVSLILLFTFLVMAFPFFRQVKTWISPEHNLDRYRDLSQEMWEELPAKGAYSEVYDFLEIMSRMLEIHNIGFYTKTLKNSWKLSETETVDFRKLKMKKMAKKLKYAGISYLN